MADARKCDRCGICFDHYDQGFFQMVSFRNPVYQTSKDLENGTYGRYYLENRPNEMIHLCPKCTGDFTLFMEGNPLAVEANSFDKADNPEKKEMTIEDWANKEAKDIEKWAEKEWKNICHLLLDKMMEKNSEDHT